MTNHRIAIGVGALALFGVFSASAQTSDGSGVGVTGERAPGAINMGGVFVRPTVDVLVGNNNNVASSPSVTRQPSAQVPSPEPLRVPVAHTQVLLRMTELITAVVNSLVALAPEPPLVPATFTY